MQRETDKCKPNICRGFGTIHASDHNLHKIVAVDSEECSLHNNDAASHTRPATRLNVGDLKVHNEQWQSKYEEETA